jgi:hypothetical protein
MLRLGRCVCPKCGREHHGEGCLGTASQCVCGYWFSNSVLDKVRLYWILQLCFCFSLTTLFISFALFCDELPDSTWGRFLSPQLQIPAISTFVVSYRALIRHKRKIANDEQLLRSFTWGVCVMTIAIFAAIIRVHRWH